MLITTSLLHVYVFLWYKKKILNKEFVSLCLLQTMIAFYFLFMVATARAATPESCRDLLQGYLTGRLSSAVGGNQIEALRRQIRTNNDVMTKTIDELKKQFKACLLYTSDAADDMQCVDLGGRRIIKKFCCA